MGFCSKLSQSWPEETFSPFSGLSLCFAGRKRFKKRGDADSSIDKMPPNPASRKLTKYHINNRP